MCGIAGIITNCDRFNSIDRHIKRMQKSLEHRGPDDRGIYLSPSQKTALAHTRLSILDLSPAGHQPMASGDGRYQIVFNGEIYNFRYLRKQLEARGESFDSHTDTEVILKLYKHYGSDCLEQLRGMFAFGIWDDREKTCFIARDPLGIKPLYYWQQGSTLLFASELKAIVATKLASLEIDPQGLYGYFTKGTVPEPFTLIKNIHCLPAGNWLKWQAGEVTQKKYWQVEFSPQEISSEDAILKVRQALIDSVEHHFVSDVPVGIFLSGGIDSTSLVALARQTQTNQLHTYSIAFAESKWNEGAIASEIARNFETNHTEYRVTADFGKQLLPRYLETVDQPSIDGFNTFCVSMVARKGGSKVVLSGLGGDELFGGYPSFQKIPQMVRMSRNMQTFQPLLRCAGSILEKWSNSHKIKRLGNFLQNDPNSVTAYQCLRGVFSDLEAIALVKQYLPDRNLEPTALDSEITFSSLEDEVSFLEIDRYMRNQLLRDSDVMSMAWGLELRVPLVDRILLETIASIPSSIRLAPGKKLLVKAIPELPEIVFNRPKQGFFFPYEQWMNGEWQDYFQTKKCPSQIPLKSWYRRWSLSMLDCWLEQIAV